MQKWPEKTKLKAVTNQAFQPSNQKQDYEKNKTCFKSNFVLYGSGREHGHRSGIKPTASHSNQYYIQLEL